MGSGCFGSHLYRRGSYIPVSLGPWVVSKVMASENHWAKIFFFSFFEVGLRYNLCMAWTPPINRKDNKALLSEDRFFRMLVQQCPQVNRDEAFLLYVGMVQLVEQELRRHKVVRLPHLGDFALVQQKARPGWMGTKQVQMAEREVLKFYPKERLRRYFNKRQGVLQ